MQQLTKLFIKGKPADYSLPQARGPFGIDVKKMSASLLNHSKGLLRSIEHAENHVFFVHGFNQNSFQLSIEISSMLEQPAVSTIIRNRRIKMIKLPFTLNVNQLYPFSLQSMSCAAHCTVDISFVAARSLLKLHEASHF